MLIKPQDHRAFISLVVGHKEIAAVAHKNARRIKKSPGLKDPLHRPVEPVHPALGRNIFGEFAQGVLVAGGLAVVVVFVIEARAGQRDITGLRMPGLAPAQFRPQRFEQPTERRMRGKA